MWICGWLCAQARGWASVGWDVMARCGRQGCAWGALRCRTCPRGGGDRAVVGARRARGLVGSRCWRGWGGVSPPPCCFGQAGVPLSLATKAQGCVPARPHPFSLQGVSALHPTRPCCFHSSPPVLCWPPGCNPHSILRTSWAPQGQGSEPDTKPATGSGHPEVQTCCCQGLGDRDQQRSYICSGISFGVGVQVTGHPCHSREASAFHHPLSCAATPGAGGTGHPRPGVWRCGGVCSEAPPTVSQAPGYQKGPKPANALVPDHLRGPPGASLESSWSAASPSHNSKSQWLVLEMLGAPGWA